MKLQALLPIAAAFMLVASAHAGNNPVDENWWPSEFGADDEAGATNWITPEKRMSAAALVKTGRVATLGMPYHNTTPLCAVPYDPRRWCSHARFGLVG